MARVHAVAVLLLALTTAAGVAVTAPPLPSAAAINYAGWSAIAKAARQSEFTVTADANLRAGHFAGIAFADLGSTNQGLRAVRQGRLLINGDPASHASFVASGDRVTLLPPQDSSGGDDADARQIAFAEGLIKAGTAWVVHEEDSFAVVHKPAGIHTKPYGAPPSLETALPGLLTPPPQDAGPPLHAPVAVHRLDCRVSGLVVVAKTRKAAADLAELFRLRKVEKRYRAIALGVVAPPAAMDSSSAEFELSTPIDGKPALTRVRILEVTPHVQAGSITTLDLWPKTGRRHQLRRHCAELGHPLLGDDLYKHEWNAADAGTDASFYGKRSSGLFLQSCEVAFPYEGRWISCEVDEGRKFARMRERSQHGWEHQAAERDL